MKRIADILTAKGGSVHCIGSTASVFEAVQSMVNHNVGSLIVTEGDQIRGIITERDYLREIVLKDRTSKTTPVRDIMTSRVICVGPDESIEECMAIMTEQRIRHLPVLADGKLAGLISIGDLVKQLSRDQKTEIRYLTDYISGKYPA